MNGLFQKRNEETTDYNSNPKEGYDPFKVIADAETYRERSVYPDPGVYPILYVDTVKMVRSQRKGVDIFIAEFDILESQVTTRPKGTRMAWAASLLYEASPADIKMFLATMYGRHPDDVARDDVKRVCAPDNPSRGRLIRLDATTKKTKKKGGDFTVCRWSPIPEEKQAQAEELRKQAGFAPF